MPGRPKELPNPIDHHVAQQLRDVRTLRGLKILDLAHKTQIPYQSIQSYENGATRIPAGKLKMLADALDITPNDFYTGVAQDPAVTVPFKLSADDVELLHAIQRMKQQRLKRLLIDMISSLS